jgi:HTH-type transcriptional regulator/antitoxin HipB
MENKKLKTTSLDVLIDKHIGQIGTEKRDAFEQELQLDIIGYTIRTVRKERNLTQEQLGELVGVKKAQISKLENSLTDARFETILKVFKALNAKVNFNVELLDEKIAVN